MWNHSKSPISYVWGKISDCHIVEVEPCTGTIGGVPCWGRTVSGCGRVGLCCVLCCTSSPQHRPPQRAMGHAFSSSASRFFVLSPEPNEVEHFELNFTGGAPGPMIVDLPCDIKDSAWPVVLHIEAAFKVLLGRVGRDRPKVASVSGEGPSPLAAG